ncbi:MAG: hypothetical protein AC479_04790 [miscellaneous Crenarchaeota group-6 archaeon AD8-1]|nr:MAG: hypothetical protein AC479_04790 [miscellaneous Crenarchaeota group-6 archaeon AD8-1]
MALVDPITLIVVVIVVAFSSIVIILAMRKREEKPKTIKETKAQPDLSGLPFRITKSIPKTEANEAKDELRILDVEREILSDAIRRLYEAHAEGKISESERDRLAGTYKTRMMNIRDSISKDEKVVALHELENMQEDLVKLFSERFGDLNFKVEELRSKIDVEPVKEVKIRTKSLESLEEQEEEIKVDKKRKRRKSTTELPTPKSEAEKRIEAITSEVEKVLDKLGQIEIDS